jgi:antitoxin component YwqK of YwqJK toxin-antitoxin module
MIAVSKFILGAHKMKVSAGILIGLLFVVVVLSIVVDILFGDAQRSKIHYITQRYYLNKEIKIPQAYTGFWLEWEENGLLVQSKWLENGVEEGVCDTFDGKGILLSRKLFKQGKLNGKSIYFYQSGNVKSISNWVDDKLEGESIGKYQNGKLEFKCKYLNNKFTDDYFNYFVNGQIEIQGQFKNNDFVGLWFFWDNNGVLVLKLNSDEPKEHEILSEKMIEVLKIKS